MRELDAQLELEVEHHTEDQGVGATKALGESSTDNLKGGPKIPKV